jgi:serine/threonine protein kinase
VFVLPLMCLQADLAVADTVAFDVAQKQGLREGTARKYFQQLVVALDYCHSLGIALRDIKVQSACRAGHALQHTVAACS